MCLTWAASEAAARERIARVLNHSLVGGVARAGTRIDAFAADLTHDLLGV